ncbi:MAG: cysteine desulfurase family protein [Chitinophagales bacterium]
MRVYLDNAATTSLDQRVLEAMLPYMQQHFGNPSSIHAYGRETRAAIEKARKQIAALFEVSPGEIFFTSGGTEANNTALQCSVRDLGVTRIITSRIEHHAVTHTVEALENNHQVEVHYVDLLADGSVDYTHLEKLLAETDGKKLVSLMHANNEIGILLRLNKVSNLCAQYNALFHCDMVQTIAHYPISLKNTKVHFASCAAHKFHGPKGVGFLYVNAEAAIKPLIHGGAQERNMRAGTENLYGIIGLAKALEIAYAELEETKAHILALRTHMRNRLQNEMPGLMFNSPEDGLYTVLNVHFPPSDKNEMLLFNLDIEGIAVSGGSACSSGSSVGSHVIAALNRLPDSAAVRFSFSKNNTIEEVDFVVDTLRALFPVAVV